MSIRHNYHLFLPNVAKIIIKINCSVFPTGDVRKVMDDMLARSFDEETPFTTDLNSKCTQLCEEIKYRLKMDKKLDRFKVIVQICAGEQVKQGFQVGSRCVWDSGVDGFATASFANKNICVVATAFGLYFE